jgi:hypothetical protein
VAKRPGRETDSSLSPIAHVRNEWGYFGISTTPYANILWTNTNTLYGALQHVISWRYVTFKVFILLQLKIQLACYVTLFGGWLVPEAAKS